MLGVFSSKGLAYDNFLLYNEWTDIDCPSHCHHLFEVVFVLSGEFIIEKEDKIYTLGKNDVMIIMPYEMHKFTTKQHSEIAVLEIATSLISGFDTLFKNKVPQNPCFNITDDNLKFIYEHLSHVSADNCIEINCTVFTIFSLLLKNTELICHNEPNDFFRKAVIYTHNHFEENIVLKDVASALNISYVYLSRIFSKNSIKFNDFLNGFRLEKAITLLRNPTLSISDVCYTCGFGSLRNFNRVFLKNMLCTPKEFRKKYTN